MVFRGYLGFMRMSSWSIMPRILPESGGDSEHGTHKTVKARYKTGTAKYKTAKATHKTVKAAPGVHAHVIMVHHAAHLPGVRRRQRLLLLAEPHRCSSSGPLQTHSV